MIVKRNVGTEITNIIADWAIFFYLISKVIVEIIVINTLGVR